LAFDALQAKTSLYGRF
jgi:hypothetical protein